MIFNHLHKITDHGIYYYTVDVRSFNCPFVGYHYNSHKLYMTHDCFGVDAILKRLRNEGGYPVGFDLQYLKDFFSEDEEFVTIINMAVQRKELGNKIHEMIEKRGIVGVW